MPIDPSQPLALRIRDGDPAAESELIHRHGPAVRRLLHRRTRNPADAEDLFQDTFRLALEKLRAGALHHSDRLPGFLLRIARNLAVEHYRKLDRRRTEPDSGAVEAEAVPSHQLAHLLAAERLVLVHRVLCELSRARDREVLYRFYLLEEERHTLAADLGLTVRQLDRLLHRARGRYRVLLEARYAALARARSLLARSLAALPMLSLWWTISRRGSG